MELTDADVSNVPRANIRVARSVFIALWVAAECRLGEHPSDWYAAGVAVTCRWLAGATVRPKTGDWYPAKSPVTRRSGSAYPELIAAECLAAERQAFRRPVPTWLQNQPGWAVAILNTLNWAWRRTGESPLEIGPPVPA